MNIVIPPKMVALLRFTIALVVAIPISYLIGADYGYLYGLYAPFLLIFCMPWVVMIAPKQEVLFGFLMAALAWGHYAVTDHRRFYDNAGWEWLVDAAAMCALTCVLSLIVTVPIYLWRKWRRRVQVSPLSNEPFYVEHDSDIWPPVPKV